MRADPATSASEAPVRLGVVVVTYNSAETVGALLDSLRPALEGVDEHVVVVDNGSEDGTRQVVARYPEVSLLECGNDGYASGINRGYAVLSECSHILILNPDTLVSHDAVTALLSAARLRPRAGIVVPRIQVRGELDLSLRREPRILRSLGLSGTGFAALSEHVAAGSEYGRAHVTDWAVGAAMLVTRECMHAVGGWDESYFLYSEETDFCLAARDRGFATWYEPEAVVEHLEGGSGRSSKTHAMQAVNRVRLYRRRHTMPAAGLYLLLTAAQEGLWSLRGEPKSPHAFRALLRRDDRPDEIGATKTWIPR